MTREAVIEVGTRRAKWSVVRLREERDPGVGKAARVRFSPRQVDTVLTWLAVDLLSLMLLKHKTKIDALTLTLCTGG